MRPVPVRMIALAVGAFALLAATAAAAAAPAKPDPWARVPALPTACYQSDGFSEMIADAEDAAGRDIDRQETINRELRDRLQTMDPMELASRQQQYMMDHPQEAMALMERNYAVGQSTAGVDNEENRQALVRDLDEIDDQYRAALDARLGPFKARFEELDGRAQKDLVAYGESWGYAPWAVDEYNALTRQENAAYEEVCAEWWAPSGPFRGWLERYRDHLLRDSIPYLEETQAVGTSFMVMAIGTPTESYESTVTLTAVKEYMDQVARVFERRRPWPNPPMPTE